MTRIDELDNALQNYQNAKDAAIADFKARAREGEDVGSTKDKFMRNIKDIVRPLIAERDELMAALPKPEGVTISPIGIESQEAVKGI